MDSSLPERIGRYRVFGELGRGAMGVVYRAEDPLLNRAVAIKTILMPSDPVVRAEYEARFQQEAKAAGGLNHPNLITIYDIGREGDIAYMAMELLEGVELRDMMRSGRLELPFVLEVLAQVAGGLAYAHERGVVHRDVKPGNIMILGGRHAKVMDFGVARMRASEIETQVGAVLGSPKYMSPEQVAAGRVDGRSDVFSLGVLLYELATGSPPFAAPDVRQYMLQIAGATPAPPSDLNPALPPMFDLIVARALEKDPEQRYQSAADFAADLRACLGQLGSGAPGLDFEFDRTAGPGEMTLDATGTGAPADRLGQLPLSRRFDSDTGLGRLAALAAAGRSADGAPPPVSQWLNQDPLLATLAAGAAIATLAALVIALL
ncbi:MAG TPA: serine/threonine-protein kinase [Burkholderiales bacterium]|nr:serine/threonine-protein kinase [Burkholderiales bacterium]